MSMHDSGNVGGVVGRCMCCGEGGWGGDSCVVGGLRCFACVVGRRCMCSGEEVHV